MIGGKVMMDRNAPEALCDTPQSGYDDTKELIANWHDVDRLSYAITPRFAITSTPTQLEMAQALMHEHPECYMQTHLSENLAEIEFTKQLYQLLAIILKFMKWMISWVKKASFPNSTTMSAKIPNQIFNSSMLIPKAADDALT